MIVKYDQELKIKEQLTNMVPYRALAVKNMIVFRQTCQIESI